MNEGGNGRTHHRAMLLTSVLVMALPWAISEYDRGTFFVSFQAPGQLAGFGCVLFLLGAMLYRESKLYAVIAQSTGLLAYIGSHHVDMAYGYWVAWGLVLIAWAFVLKPNLLERLFPERSDETIDDGLDNEGLQKVSLRWQRDR